MFMYIDICLLFFVEKYIYMHNIYIYTYALYTICMEELANQKTQKHPGLPASILVPLIYMLL